MVDGYNIPMAFLRVGIIKIIIWTIIHLVLYLVMLKVVWVLWPLTFVPVKIIVVLVVVIFYLLRVGVINQLLIKRKKGFLIQYFRGGMIILVFMVTVEVGLVPGPLTYTPRNI